MNSLLTQIWKNIVYNGYLLSTGASMVILTCNILFDTTPSIKLIITVFCGIQAVYLLNHFIEKSGDIDSNPKRVEHLNKNKTSIILHITISLLVIILIIVSSRNYKPVLATVSLLILGGAYTVLLKKITRFIPLFKNIFVALVWAGLVILYWSYFPAQKALEIMILAMIVFFQSIVGTTLYDFKDIDSDRKSNLKTLPILAGPQTSLKILFIINLLEAIAIIASVSFKIIPPSFAFLILIPAYNHLLLSMHPVISKKHPFFFYYTLIDGRFMLWPLFVILSKIFS